MYTYLPASALPGPGEVESLRTVHLEWLNIAEIANLDVFDNLEANRTVREQTSLV